MINYDHVKLGKKAARHDPRVRTLAMVTADLPAAPERTNWRRPLSNDMGMMLNDELGDCTCAAIGHSIQTVTCNARKAIVTIPDSAVLDLYEKSCGYNPADSRTDQGGIETDVLGYVLRHPVAGNKLDAFAAVTPADHQQVKDAIWICGGVYMGIQMPLAWKKTTAWDAPWPAHFNFFGPWKPGSWGGHATIGVDYTPRGIWLVTWGHFKFMTWAGWDAYVDEAYALLWGQDWFDALGHTPAGFDYQKTVEYLNALRS